MSKLFLSNDSFVCHSMGYMVFLDLRRERYLALPPDDAARLRSFLSSNAPLSVNDGPYECDVASMLEVQGLLVRDGERGRSFAPSVAAEPRVAICADDEVLPRLHNVDIMHFVSAWATVSTLLRLRSLRAIVSRVKARKTRRANSAAPSNEAREMLGLARIFAILQPMLPSSGSSDIRKSLTLIEFLARYDLYPAWVFGVRLSPFAAASWVQHGDAVLSSSVDSIRGYTPLMVI
jgi:hypothetical protein